MQRPQTTIVQGERPVRVGQQPNAIPLEALRAALFQAAWHATIAAVAYRGAVLVESRRGSGQKVIDALASSHAHELATDTDIISGLWCAVLGLEYLDAAAPLGWAIQEIIEWVDAWYRYHELGEDDQRVPLSWSPADLGKAPLRLEEIVEQRLRLLTVELDDYDVDVIDSQ
jgi:hypothetical protein